ncbi:MAG: SAM-dependent methyltransferase [Sphingomonadales bacterium 32-64-17]|nr:MAG: SAM-dependent methyltransferase [Sphingomonadales bacterium 32-64-17]
MVDAARDKHWISVYEDKAPDAVSWYQAEPEPSLMALKRLERASSSSIIDVGGGASNLVDALLEQGWDDITVLDIVAPALEVAKLRLGAKAAKVHWQVADITNWQPPRKYDVWHDRAVFHFLTEAEQREAYREALYIGLSKGGLVIMATFALDGPQKCSGLPVQRYDADGLARELGPQFRLIESWREKHVTPWGSGQEFNWCAFRLIS